MYNPFIVIVIPTYNSRPTLEHVIKALEETEYPKEKLGLIFVDGGSRDGTLEFLEEWAKNAHVLGFKFVKIIRLNRRGVVIARNLGLNEALKAGAEFVFMLDSDVLPPKNFLNIALEHFNRDNRICIVAAPVMREPPSLFELLNVSRWPYPYGFVEVAPPGAWLIKAECIENVGIFNEKLGYPHSDWEQAEYSSKARRKGWKLIVDWRLKCIHLKFEPVVRKNSSRSTEDSLFKLMKFSIKRYLVFLPHIWHELIKVRPIYYLTLTIAHFLVPVALVLSPLMPLVLLYPLIILLVYVIRAFGLRSPIPLKIRILNAIGIAYMRTLIALGYIAWLARHLAKR